MSGKTCDADRPTKATGDGREATSAGGGLPTAPSSEGLHEAVKDGEPQLWFVANISGWWAYSLRP